LDFKTEGEEIDTEVSGGMSTERDLVEKTKDRSIESE
jgi:hypothetical protein